MAKASGADTPVMRQYLAAKEQYPDALMFFRLGDFYELFFQDAVVTAKQLDLTLTSRNKNAEDPIPMCGVPHHAVSAYVQRLLDAGFKVAICEQMADPATIKGIVPREVVRIATPAITFDDAGIDAKQNLFLCAIERTKERIGIAALDFSTGELTACEARTIEEAIAELVRLDPREVLGTLPGIEAALPRATVRAAEPVDGAARVDDALGKGTAKKSGASKEVLIAAARCLDYARICEPRRKIPVNALTVYPLGETLVLDEAAQRHLELVRTMDGETKGSLLAQIDLTRTSPGARLIRRRLLAPRTNVAEIRRRLDGVELFVTQPGLRAEIRDHLANVADVERLAVKLEVDRTGPRELASLRASLAELPAIAKALAKCSDALAEEQRIEDRCEDLCKVLTKAIVDEPPLRASDGGIFRDGYDKQLDEARVLTRDGQRLIVELETRLREQASIASLKLRYTRVFGWYIEVTKSHLSKAPKAWRRKQTIATGERFTCDELDELADKLASAESQLESREGDLFIALVSEISKHAERLRTLSGRLAALDVSCALAELAHRDDYARPDVDDSAILELCDARHPVVEKLAAAGRFVPNDVLLDGSEDGQEARLWIVTGPNMAGKSTFMRQVAIAVILAQMGSFVPAKKARVGVVDRVLTRVGASDALARGESTFMVEMKETASILKSATSRSLVVLDEIGRGTSTYDGLSIAFAVAEHLHDVAKCRALFATHYHELTQIVDSRPRAENHGVSAREHAGNIVFFHKVQKGAASRSYGVACAKLAGVPEPVLVRARSILESLERGERGSKRAAPQLDLFARGSSADPPPPEPALEMLRGLDVERMTPIEALTKLAELVALSK